MRLIRMRPKGTASVGGRPRASRHCWKTYDLIYPLWLPLRGNAQRSVRVATHDCDPMPLESYNARLCSATYKVYNIEMLRSESCTTYFSGKPAIPSTPPPLALRRNFAGGTRGTARQLL